MTFDDLKPLDVAILESFKKNKKYSEVQELLRKQNIADFQGRQLQYRINTIKKNFGYVNQIELGYHYGRHTLKQQKREMFLVGLLSGLLVMVIACLLIWYFSMFN